MLQQGSSPHPGGTVHIHGETCLSLYSQLFFLPFSKSIPPRSSEALCCGRSFQGEGKAVSIHVPETS